MTSSKDGSQTSWGIAPVFTGTDVVATANYYRDQPGFSYDRFWGEPASFCMVSRRGVVIMLARPRDICDQDYGCRDFDVEDCNGYRLCFGHTRT